MEVELAAKWRDCSYLHDLIEQPNAVARTIAALADEQGLDRLSGSLCSGRWRRVVLTGMGSSYWACRPLYLRLLKEGLTPVMVETGELIHYERDWLSADTLVVAVSQSGRSVEIVRLLECARGRSEIIGVTNTPDSPLATGSAATLLMRAGSECTVSCKTYLATLLALDWLGDLLCGSDRRSLLDQARRRRGADAQLSAPLARPCGPAPAAGWMACEHFSSSGAEPQSRRPGPAV